MPSKPARQSCAMCGETLPPREECPSFPFCSERCQLHDLSRWLDGDYAIPGEPNYDDEGQ